MGEMTHDKRLKGIWENKYDELKEVNDRLRKEMDKVISEYDKLKEDYNELVDENKVLTETLDGLKAKHQSAGESIERVCNDCRKLREENNELKSKIHYILGGGIVSETLDPVLSETPSVVINTKSINITFDNHTNNFKEDDAND
jgi:predicted nuclease with TOPRIM domain